MPEMRNYIVKQTRSVKVRANNAHDASMIAAMAFAYGQNSDSSVAATQETNEKLKGVWGNTTSRVKELDLICERIDL